MTANDVLPDVLRPGLRLLFCGSAAGRVSAARQAYYAHPQNRFWPTLHEVGLTPVRLLPAQYRELLRYGIGLTDVTKHQSGADTDLTEADPDRVRETVRRCRPAALAFNGKRAAGLVLGCGTGSLAYGCQAKALAGVTVWVLPSTSPLAVRWWSIEPWRALAGWLATVPG